MRIKVTTQAEFDALPARFDEYTIIEICPTIRLVVNVARENSSVVARGNSSVEAWGNSSVVARENSSVVARENSSVVARENSSVVARENSSVEAWGNSSVEAWGNSSVEAWGNSSVEAWENSSVVARGNSSVVARGNCCARLNSTVASVRVHGWAVCYVLQPGKVEKKSETATIITPEQYKGNFGWLDQHGVEIQTDDQVTLYKRVSSDFRTQEGQPWEQRWEIGSSGVHPSWNPTAAECGAGKYHACPRPYFCDDFRSVKGDVYIALRIKVADLHAWDRDPEYAHKIAFKSYTVLYQCDRLGQEIKAAS